MLVNWERAKKIVFSRDSCCVRCLGEAQDCHHRKVRGMGGTRDVDTALGLANLITLCRECHDWVHSHPKLAYDDGYLVHSWDDPADVPVKIKPGSGLLKFNADGTTEQIGECAPLF